MTGKTTGGGAGVVGCAVLLHGAGGIEDARRQYPERWSGEIRDWSQQTEVWLNPPREVRAKERSVA